MSHPVGIYIDMDPRATTGVAEGDWLRYDSGAVYLVVASRHVQRRTRTTPGERYALRCIRQAPGFTPPTDDVLWFCHWKPRKRHR